MKFLPRASEAQIYDVIINYLNEHNEFTAFDITSTIRRGYFVDHDDVRSVFAEIISKNPVFGKVYDNNMGCYIYFKISGGDPKKYSFNFSNLKLIASLGKVTVEDYVISKLSKPTSDGRINISSSVISESVRSDRVSLIYLDGHYMLVDDLSKLNITDALSESRDYRRLKDYSVDNCNRVRLNTKNMAFHDFKRDFTIQRVLLKTEFVRLVRGLVFIPL